MPHVDGLRSPYDKTAGGLHHLSRMFDKIRLKAADRLPEEYHRNYGLSVGLDGQLCGFLSVKFEDVEARVKLGGTDEELAEWVFAHGLRPNRTQLLVWNEYSRKLGWNDRVSAFLRKQKDEAGFAVEHPANTSFDLIDLSEGRELPAARS